MYVFYLGRPAVWQSQGGTNTGGCLTKQFKQHLLQHLARSQRVSAELPVVLCHHGLTRGQAAKSRQRLWVGAPQPLWTVEAAATTYPKSARPLPLSSCFPLVQPFSSFMPESFSSRRCCALAIATYHLHALLLGHPWLSKSIVHRVTPEM